MKCKIAISVLVLLLVFTNAWHVDSLAELGIRAQGSDELLHEFATQLENTATLADLAVQGKTEAEAVDLLKRLFPASQPVVTSSMVFTPPVSLELGPDGRVQRLHRDESWAGFARSAAPASKNP
jgi:hypothetical protein